MPTFNVTVTDTIGGFAALIPAIRADALFAGAAWAPYLVGGASLEIQINIAETPSNTANGTAATNVFVSTSNGVNVFRAGTIAELLSGIDPNGGTADIIINYDPDFIAQTFFDPNPSATSAVPADKVDGVRVFEHEIGHALGFNGFLDWTTGQRTGNAISTFDPFVSVVGGVPYFTGPNAQALYGGPVPLTASNLYHLANREGLPGNDLINDIMNGVVTQLGKSPGPSAIDLAILKDVGVPIVQAGGDLTNGTDTVVLTTLGGTWRALAGNDTVTGTTGIDIIYGGAGNDTLIGNGGGDALFGDDGNDVVWATAQTSIVRGGAGYDYLQFTDNVAHTFVLGNAGFETVIGRDAADNFDLRGLTSDQLVIVWGMGGDDTIRMGATPGYAYGGLGNDTLIGGEGIDVLIGDAGADRLFGNGGNDVLWVDGLDTIDGGAGIDWAILLSTTGDRLTIGNNNVEVAAGNSGNDIIDARANTTGIQLWGGGGADNLFTGSGNDHLYGGSDGLTDIFHFSAGWGLDQIWDFEDGIDKISLAEAGVTSVGQLAITASGTTAIVTLIGTANQIYVANAAGRIDASDFIFA